MAEKALLAALVLIACGTSEGTSTTSTAAPDAAAIVDGSTSLSEPPASAPPDCNRQSYPGVLPYEPGFDAQRASSDPTTRIGEIYKVADLAPLDDGVRWL